MNEKRFTEKTEIETCYTKQAGRNLAYLVGVDTGEAIVIRKTHVRYAFLGVHRFKADAGWTTSFSFHARRDLAEKARLDYSDPRQYSMQIVKIENLADRCKSCGNDEAIGKDVDQCVACQSGGEDQLKSNVACLLDVTSQLPDEKPVSSIRARLAGYLDGEFVPFHVIRLDLMELGRRDLERSSKEVLDEHERVVHENWTDDQFKARDALEAFLAGKKGDDVAGKIETLREAIRDFKARQEARFQADALKDRVIMAARRSKHLVEPKLVRARERLALWLDGKLETSDEMIEQALDALEHALAENPDQETIERDTQERISADVKRLGDQWIEECMHELNLKIVLREISEGERQVLKGILEQVRAGRKA